MSDQAAAPAPAAADTSAPAAAPEEPVSLPNPVKTEPSPPEPQEKPEPKEKGDKPEPKKAPSSREALEKAAKKVEAAEKSDKGAKPEPDKTGTDKPESKPAEKSQPEPKEDRERDETGKFVPKDGAKPEKLLPAHEAPPRFSPQAKAEWAKAPESVRAEILRRESEYAAGIEKHRAEIDPLRPYMEMAKQHGTTIKDALDRYTGLERELRGENRMEAIGRVFQYAGVSPKDFAAHVLGQAAQQEQQPDAATTRLRQENASLRQEIASLKGEVSNISKSIQQQFVDTKTAEVTKFFEAHPRAEELAEDIKFFISSGRTRDLAEAYRLAERLNPAPNPVVTDQTRNGTHVALADQTRGTKSITGAPGPGSDPATIRSPSPTVRDALKRAFAQAE